MIKLKERYYIKIVPQRGDKVHRLELTRRHIMAAAILLGAATFGSLGFAGVQTLRAHAEVASLRTQSAVIQQIDKKADSLHSQLQAVQKQNQEIQQLIGVKPGKPAAASRVQKTSWTRTGGEVGDVSRHIDQLGADSQALAAESNLNRTLTMRILNMRHIQALGRARMLAYIPSIDPVAGAVVIGCFCYRTSPDVEFHKGVDLDADYQTVRASAAGTVVAADWDGSYGQKIVIDHGNGYQTWYAHLSRIDVHPGQTVYKGQTIAVSGSTGFSTGPHLHYQLMHDGTPIDPSPFLNGVPANVLASLP
jgi:murein DD-endopeptidase MepM/ murein hydrolase activator NlpD